MIQTLQLRGIVFLPKESYTIRRMPTRAEKYRAFQRRSVQVALSPLGLLWLLTVGLAVGLVSLLVATPRLAVELLEVVHREGEAAANFVTCIRLAIPVLSVLVCVLAEETVNYYAKLTNTK